MNLRLTAVKTLDGKIDLEKALQEYQMESARLIGGSFGSNSVVRTNSKPQRQKKDDERVGALGLV